MKIEIEVDDHAVLGVVISGVEGGIRHWCKLVDGYQAIYDAADVDGVKHPDYLAIQGARFAAWYEAGGKLVFHERVADDVPQPCDACGLPIDEEKYATDDEVCEGGDGPGFFLCERTECLAKHVAMTLEERRAYFRRRLREKAHVLDKAAIERGLTVLARTLPHHFRDLMGDFDAATGDYFLQCCLFGEVMYE